MDEEAIDLDLAALDLSALDHPGIDLAPYRLVLQEIGTALAAQAGGAATGEDQAAALQGVLHGGFGFTGDREAYDAVVNADMIRVIDRRRGLPVALSILYVAQARRMGWTAYPMDLPGHVLVRVGPAKNTVLLDPFNQGDRFPTERLAAMIGSLTGSSQALPRIGPMSNHIVLLRLLLNQAARAEEDCDIERAIVCYERMKAVGPAYVHPRWELVRLHLLTQSYGPACSELNALLEMATTDDLRTRIETMLGAIGRQGSDRSG